MKITRSAWICALLSVAAQTFCSDPACASDFFKCKDAAGRTSYQDQPCETGSGKALDIKSQAPARRNDINYDRVSDSERAARRDIDAARRLDQDREAAQRSADWDRRMNQIDREADERAERWRRALNK